MDRIYLDNAAATPLDERVLQAMMPYLTNAYGNPSSLHYFGQQARAAVQCAREEVAQCLGVHENTVIFTAGGTEADNLAILGYLRANYPDGGHIITTAVEHPAVLQTFRYLSRQGYEVTIVPVGPDGRVSPDDIKNAIQKDTVLVSVMYANNETGTIQPIQDIGRMLQEKGITFHVDAVQAFGYLPIAPAAEHIDMLTICSHKIYGPKGVGALYVRPGISLAANAFGGPQEQNLRAGTENVSGIVGFGKAAALLVGEREQRFRHVLALKECMARQIMRYTDKYHINGSQAYALPNILNFSIRGLSSDVVLIALDRKGIAVSAGSACAAGAIEASHVLQAMHVDEAWLRSSIRVSFSNDNNEHDVDAAVSTLQQVVKKLLHQEE